MNRPLDDLCDAFFGAAILDFKTGLLSGITLGSDFVFFGSIRSGLINSNGGGGTEKSGGGTEKSGGGKAKFIGCFTSIGGGGGSTGGINLSIGFVFDELMVELFFVATGIRFGYVFGENCGLSSTIYIDSR